MEGGKGGAGGDALVLANPITKRVTEVEGAAVGGSERDVMERLRVKSEA